MEQLTGSWMSSNQETIFFQTWKPDAAPKGVILILHGLGEHSGRYNHVAAWFTKHDYLVQAYDLPGHGKSDGVRGHAKSFAAVHDITNHFIAELNQAYPNIPLILYGHSMGGELALDYGFSNSAKIDGLISSSPGLIPGNPPAKILIALSGILQAISPKTQMNNNLPLEGLSRDTTVVERYKADPLVHPLISMKMGHEIISRGRWLIDHAAEYPEVPLLLQVGEKDMLVSPSGPIEFAKNHPPMVCKVWPGLYHEMHNEPEKEEIFNYMLKWMQELKVIRHS
jgi:alpha-beta hydrolase superfamily lysophospholipase